MFECIPNLILIFISGYIWSIIIENDMKDILYETKKRKYIECTEEYVAYNLAI